MTMASARSCDQRLRRTKYMNIFHRTSSSYSCFFIYVTDKPLRIRCVSEAGRDSAARAVRRGEGQKQGGLLHLLRLAPAGRGLWLPRLRALLRLSGNAVYEYSVRVSFRFVR